MQSQDLFRAVACFFVAPRSVVVAMACDHHWAARCASVSARPAATNPRTRRPPAPKKVFHHSRGDIAPGSCCCTWENHSPAAIDIGVCNINTSASSGTASTHRKGHSSQCRLGHASSNTNATIRGSNTVPAVAPVTPIEFASGTTARPPQDQGALLTDDRTQHRLVAILAQLKAQELTVGCRLRQPPGQRGLQGRDGGI